MQQQYRTTTDCCQAKEPYHHLVLHVLFFCSCSCSNVEQLRTILFYIVPRKKYCLFCFVPEGKKTGTKQFYMEQNKKNFVNKLFWNNTCNTAITHFLYDLLFFCCHRHHHITIDT